MSNRLPFNGRPIVDREALHRAASTLAEKLRDFQPTKVVFIQKGGETLGRAVAAHLSVPATGVDIAYPASRLPVAANKMLFPFKELLYRVTKPRMHSECGLHLTQNDRVVVVDDSASSGRTLRRAVDYLTSVGIDTAQIQTAVFRAGPRAAPLVDAFVTGERVFFRR